MLNLGTVRPGSTIYLPVNTFDSNDPSGSVTATTWLNTDVHIHKDGGTTQRASSAGETLTIDFDTVTGNHLVQIDLADNTTANFYEAGSWYMARIEGVTVDAGNVNAWIGMWYIGYEDAVANTTIATLASQTSFTLEEGSADDDAYNGFGVIIHDLASSVQLAHGIVSDYTGSTKTVTLKADPGIFTMAAGDSISLFAPTLTATTPGSTLDVTATGAAGIDWGNVENKTTANDLSATDIQLCDTVTTLTNHTPQTGDTYALANGANGFAAIVTDLDDIKGTGFVKDTHSLVDIEAYVDLIDDGTSGLAKIATDAAAILDDTGTNGVALLAATQASIDAIETDTNSLNDTKIPDTISLANINTQVDTAFTTQMADSTVADGTIPTREQAILFLVRFLTEFGISGTTMTVNKEDGTTAVATFTLDDATNPTSLTRAT